MALPAPEIDQHLSDNGNDPDDDDDVVVLSESLKDVANAVEIKEEVRDDDDEPLPTLLRHELPSDHQREEGEEEEEEEKSDEESDEELGEGEKSGNAAKNARQEEEAVQQEASRTIARPQPVSGPKGNQ